MVKIEDLTVQYDQTIAVDSIHLEIQEGEFFTFLGPSGCGKTTTLRAISGFIQPTKGCILLNDKDVTHLKPEERNVGVVFQNYALFPHMTVAENIGFSLSVRRCKKDVIQEKVHHYAQSVNVEEHLHKRVTALSGGQQQRVAIARCLIMEPEILLLDEPLSNLDAKLRLSMRDELKRIQRDMKITTIYVTHDQEEALTLSDRIAVFSKGKIEQVGTPFEIYQKPSNEFVCCFIGEVNTLTSDLLRQAGQLSEGDNAGIKRYIRKENIRIVEESNSSNIVLSAKIIDRIYMGYCVNYRVELSDHTIWDIRSYYLGNNIYDIDDSIKLSFNINDIMTFGGANEK